MFKMIQRHMEANKGGRIADIYKFVLTFVFQLKGKQQHFEQTQMCRKPGIVILEV